MKKQDRLKLDAALDKALAPPKIRPKQNLDALLDDYDSKESTQPIPTHPNPSQANPYQPKSEQIAPSKDFNRRANSLEREALPKGLFPGTSKKLYDALYLRTRGAVVPVRTIQATKRELKDWSGLRSKNTIDLNLQILTSIGLIHRTLETGNREGSTYEVKLPEELGLQSDPSQPIPSQPIPTQKLGWDPTQKLGWDRLGNPIENKGTYEFPKTFFKTNTEIDDDLALAGLVGRLKGVSKEITGKEPSKTERARWDELAELLVTELRIAAARTTISNVPAFLTEHLRRRLWKMDQKQMSAAGKSAAGDERPSLAAEQVKDCPDCGGTGFYYPQGFEGGVAKCRHERLGNEEPETPRVNSKTDSDQN
ncbi:MAG TPA: hypothetical protein VGO91_11615 [Pyrinomonadaceae bacterium]|jgi:hypothetical protein|nr:hypothetical protein [Pyrinomonadaceae bacterium]